MSHLGILSLDTAFPRIVGDAGNPNSYPFDAVVGVVRNADAATIVSDRAPGQDIIDAFSKEAQTLEAGGAGAIVSTCGFLVHAQMQVASAVRIPVMLSPLSLVPLVQTLCPGTIGILTASANALGPRTMSAAGITDVAIAGMDKHAVFRETFLATKSRQKETFPISELERLVLKEAEHLAAQRPLSALVLECGNLPPYAQVLKDSLGIPVFTILDAAEWLMNASKPPEASVPERQVFGD